MRKILIFLIAFLFVTFVVLISAGGNSDICCLDSDCGGTGCCNSGGTVHQCSIECENGGVLLCQGDGVD